MPKTILATVYAVNPYKGSEDGMGWNFVYQIARLHKVYAVTRKNNQINIDKYMLENPDSVYSNIHFLYFDTPYWMRFWKKGGRGAMLYYWIWQYFVVFFIKKTNIEFDVVHNVNFHNDWTPSYLWKLNKPFVWGPVGHHPSIPKQFLKPFSFKQYMLEKATWAVKILFWNFSIALKKTSNKATCILAMNKSVASYLRADASKFVVMPSVATHKPSTESVPKDNSFTIISAGRLVPLKGFDLTIKSFAKLLNSLPLLERDNVKLLIVGSGPLEVYLKKLSSDLQVSHHIEFISWISHSDLLQMYAKASVFLFPSHEGAGMVVAEALSHSLPVICLDNCGPGEFINDNCGVKVTYEDYEKTINEISTALLNLYENPTLLKNMSMEAYKQFQTKFDWNLRANELSQIYNKL